MVEFRTVLAPEDPVAVELPVLELPVALEELPTVDKCSQTTSDNKSL